MVTLFRHGSGGPLLHDLNSVNRGRVKCANVDTLEVSRMSKLPAADEVLGYFDKLSNWGRWGPDDQLGTLNLITPQVRVAAAACVRDGIAVSLARDLDPAQPDPLTRGTVLQRYMMIGGHGTGLSGVREYVGIVAHGSNTHLDALSHMSFNGKYYNGIPKDAVSSREGATKLSIHLAREGVITRGVLLDVAALKGKEWLDPGEGAFPEDLEGAEARQRVRVREGDALLLYTGNFRRIERQGLHPDRHNPGFTTACLPWFHERGVAVIGSDNINDVTPPGYDAPGLERYPVHAVGLVAMGLWLIDNMILDELADRCARLRRWEFMFMMLPWRLVGATSSPVNPVALF